MRPKTVNGAAKAVPAVVEVQPQRRVGLGAGRRHVGELAAAERGVDPAPEAGALRRGPRASAPAWRSRRPSRRGGSRRARSPAGRRAPGRARARRRRGRACRAGSTARSAASCPPPRGATGRSASRPPATSANSICTEGVTSCRPSGAFERLSSQSAVTPRASAIRRSVSARGMRSTPGSRNWLSAERSMPVSRRKPATPPRSSPSSVCRRSRKAAATARLSMRSSPGLMWIRYIFRVFTRYGRFRTDIHVIAPMAGSARRLAQTSCGTTENVARLSASPARVGARVEWPTAGAPRPHLCGWAGVTAFARRPRASGSRCRCSR